MQDSICIITVARYTYNELSHITKHCHNFFQLFYITGGQGEFIIDGKRFKARINDLYMIKPGTYHEIFSNADLPLLTLEVKFILKNNHELYSGLSLLPLPFRQNHNKTKIILNLLVEEAISRKKYYKPLITLKFLEVLYHLMRTSDVARSTEENQSNEVLFSFFPRKNVDDIIDYIDKNYTENITLKKLSNIFHVNSTYICRIFKENYCTSPIQYINNLRLQKVKELLRNTDKSVTEISELTGFNSLHYLSRYFTAKEKLTPIEYREKTLNAIHITVNEKYEILNNMVEDKT